MPDSLETQAEVIKLARLLGRDSAEFGYLRELPPTTSVSSATRSRRCCSARAKRP